jgi:hypothetical protein
LILTGSRWDEPLNDWLSSNCGSYLEDLTGKTTLSELIGLIRGAGAFAGWPGGNTMISTHFGINTYILWSDVYKHGFYTNWVDPDKVNRSYIFDNISDITPDMAAWRLLHLIQNNGKFDV